MRRIDQLLSNLGYCSRRDAQGWVKDGRVRVDGLAADDAARKVDPSRVTVDGEALDHPDGLLLLYYKPAGLTCSHDSREAPLIYDTLPERWKRRNPVVTSVGRLDKETSGLLLLTDQSPLVHRLTSPKKEMTKVYQVSTDRDIPESTVSLFASGTLMLENESDPCRPATLVFESPRQATLTLTEGRYHQVRRMFASLGLTVIGLHRSHFGALSLDDLEPGEWKALPLNSF